jgi:putative transposase
MMAMEIRTVQRNGVTFMGWHWYDPALYGYRDKVIIRYSYSDLRQIYVFSPQGDFLCAATPVEKVHPMGVESEAPKDWQDAKRITSEQRAAKK